MRLGDTLVWTDGEYAIVEIVRPFGSGFVCYRKVNDLGPVYNFVRLMPDPTICFTSIEAAHKFLDPHKGEQASKPEPCKHGYYCADGMPCILCREDTLAEHRRIVMDLITAIEEEARESDSAGLLCHNATILENARAFMGLPPWGSK